MVIYSSFYRAHGIRQLQQFSKPPMAQTSKLYLPMGSVYHCTDIDIEHIGVTEDDEILQAVKSNIVVEHIADLAPGAVEGNPISVNIPITSLVSDYFRTNKRFKRVGSNQSVLNNQRNLMVVSYNLLLRHYRYPKHAMQPVYQWQNIFKTVISTISKIAASNDRQHFIQLHLPPTLPPISWLDYAIDHKDRTYLKRFPTDASRTIHDIYTWISGNRSDSILSGLDESILGRVNILFMYRGQWAALNLGNLNNWRVQHLENEKTSGKLEPDVLKRRYLRFLMSVMQTEDLVTKQDDDIPEESNNEDKDKNDDTDYTETDSKTISEKLQDDLDSKSGSLTEVVKATKDSEDTISDGDDIIDEEVDVISDADVDKDLAMLETIAETAEKEDEALITGYKAYEPKEVTYASAIDDAANNLARSGRLTAAELRRYTTLGSKYKTIRNPFNQNESLEDMAIVKPEDLEIPVKNPLAKQIDGVLDASMLSSSLKNFDNHYIQKIMHKDIAGVILQLQKAGIIVQNYNVQQVDDYADSFDVHTISILPVGGEPATIRFQLPRVNENGQFKAGNVKSRMRKQRGDMPIRKTAPSTVALTSYYSKMFITRSERSNFNYDGWLTSRILAIAIDSDNSTITDVKMSDVFRQEFTLPRVYTILAKSVSSFQAGEYKFHFDYAYRAAIFGTEVSAAIDKVSAKRKLFPVAIGATDILLIDFSGGLHKAPVTDVGNTEAVGSFESFFNIDASSKPLDVAEAGIFGKLIPLGIILARHVGLGNLLVTLKAEYRTVAKGGNYDIQSNEFAIRFEDVTLIIKKEGINELVLGGFLRYQREVKRYSIYMFDKKEVYSNVLEGNSIGVRWVREFDLIFKLWVDNITKDLLVQMKEPTDMFLLLKRAAELLLTDQSPDQMDIAFMRDKGYERFAGMAYFEIVKALRGFASRPPNSKATVDLNPQAVWMSILQDQSVMPIEESNPIHALKEKEEIIFSGSGGRTAQSMTSAARIFHKNSMGVVSESTKDSGAVATVVYLTADPNYTSMRGTSRRLDKIEGNASRLVSTCMLASPGAGHDDQLDQKV